MRAAPPPTTRVMATIMKMAFFTPDGAVVSDVVNSQFPSTVIVLLDRQFQCMRCSEL